VALSKRNRLKRPKDFAAVYQQGQKAVSAHLVVRVLAPKVAEHVSNVDAQATLFGISVSQKVSKQAVVRNRLKRQIRAALRSLLPQVKPNLRIVVILRPGATVCEYDEFLRELNHLLKKLEVLNGHS
jgi:ribonuclease P protein component